MDLERASEQARLWNGRAGQAWVEAQQQLDALFHPFEAILVDAVVSTSARRVLDVGCGAGATTIAVARLPGVECIGVDVSEPLIDAARKRSADTFLCADAETHAFGPFDLVISRFGVMFFSDPRAAFANLGRTGAALSLIVWRSAAENPFMTLAERTAAPLLPEFSPRRADGPGQFAFADPERVRDILAQTGWTQISIDPIDVPLAMPASALHGYVTRVGPVGVFLSEADEQTRVQVAQALRSAFAPYVDGEQVRFNAACWHIRAAPVR